MGNSFFLYFGQSEGANWGEFFFWGGGGSNGKGVSNFFFSYVNCFKFFTNLELGEQHI